MDDTHDPATDAALLRLKRAALAGRGAHGRAFDRGVLAVVEQVERWGEFRPELVLLDIGLPKLNGYDVARQIRQQPCGRDVVLIAQTGWGQDEDRLRSREAGFDFHVVKPLDLVTP